MLLKIFLGLFLILGVIFLVVAIIVKKSFKKKKENCTQMVEARVVDITKMERTEAGAGAYVSYFPIYEYEYMGKIYRKGTNVGYMKDTFEIGKLVKLYIDPKNPEKIYENSSVSKIAVQVFGIVGVVLIVVFVILVIILLGV